MSHRTRFLSAAAALLLLIVAAACTDQSRDITAPTPSKLKIFPPPIPIGMFADQFATISGGGYHSCARKVNGRIYCWGLDTTGAAGVASARCEYWGSTQVPCVNRPQYVMTGNDVAAGYYHTCALDSNGAAYCWGDGTYGALGNGTATMFSFTNATPLPVLGGLTFSSIGAGLFSSCGVNATAIYCWGPIAQPSLPQSGPGPNQPVQMTSWIGSYQFAGISVGYGYACGPMTYPSGVSEAVCVGNNAFGVMGYDPNTTPYVPLGESFQILNTGTTTHVATHTNFTCWDENNGTVQCVGAGDDGQLGNGQPLGAFGGVGSFTPITVGGGMQLSHVSAGRFHACALDASNHAWCWGMVGLLGDGEDPSTATQFVRGPVPVSGGIQFRALGAGDKHTCGIGIDNHIYCWGQNLDGQLGNGTWGQAALIPVQALDPTS